MLKLPAIYTIGHSTRTLTEFIELLQSGHVERVVDIRTVPRSRTNPQFNMETLPQALAAQNIDYIQLAELGGLRKNQKQWYQTLMDSGSIKTFITMPTTRYPKNLNRACCGCKNSVRTSDARSCVRRPSGGVAIVESSRTTFSIAAGGWYI